MAGGQRGHPSTRDAAEGMRPFFSTTAAASTASAPCPERAMSKSFLRQALDLRATDDYQARQQGVGDGRRHAWQSCMSLFGRTL